jgi:hypothetical protein
LNYTRATRCAWLYHPAYLSPTAPISTTQKTPPFKSPLFTALDAAQSNILYLLFSLFFSIAYGGGRWIRTTEARASDLQSDPFGHSGTPPEGGTLSRCTAVLSTDFYRQLHRCLCGVSRRPWAGLNPSSAERLSEDELWQQDYNRRLQSACSGDCRSPNHSDRESRSARQPFQFAPTDRIDDGPRRP